jgi:hypothetical protein
MTDLFDAPTSPIPRDGWGRPKIVPATGGKAVAYTRCTTFVSALEDTYNLTRWKMRQVALGLADRADLLLSVSAHREDKKELDRVADAAMEAAQSSAAATTGTALHTLTELHDRGQKIGTLPPQGRADLDAYIAATAGLKYTAIEQFRVLDMLRIGGTADRIIDLGDRHVIGDVKTGDITYGIGKICMQLAVYAHSTAYDPANGRTPDSKPMDLDRGLIIHLPSGAGTCELVWVDIAAGWEAVQLAAAVRAWRARKDLVITAPGSEQLLERVDTFTDLTELRSWYVELDQRGATTAELLAACKRRAAELQAVG